MVVKQTLPDMRYFVNFVSYVILLFVIYSCDILKPTTAVQYCWKGTEDELSGWKNQSCLTGKTMLGNSLSSKLLPGNVEDNTDVPPTYTYSCMAFKHYTTLHEGPGTSVKTYTVEYGCDSEQICSGREMNKGFGYRRNGSDGILFCCNDVNNCNAHSMVQAMPHAHKCYKAFSDANTQMIDVQTCPSESTYCLQETKHEVAVDQRFKVVSERYGCDVNRLCEDNDLTDSLDKSCKSFKDPSSNLETELCCCKEDTCFIPKWIGGASSHTVKNPGPQPNGIQKTILIGIGIAIGLLVAAVALFIAIKYKRRAKASPSKDSDNKMVYSSVLMGDEMRDEDDQC